ncbi:alpha/beta fold hydrolase [Rhodococcus opacus]|uniref:alpha/beta fold hydrolase n=1 Tax=Rhodococcus opacus TaxID=37919 RepID=UPI003AF326A3
MIPGANGVADAFRMVAGHLAERYTVALYDRRGFSRSHLDGPRDYDRRLETDADDVRRLIEHLSDEPATVFGVSSGGIVALEVLTRHPSVVRTLVPFEPPARETTTRRTRMAGVLRRALRSLPPIRDRAGTAEVPRTHVRGVGPAGHGPRGERPERASSRQRHLLVRARAAPIPGGRPRSRHPRNLCRSDRADGRTGIARASGL